MPNVVTVDHIGTDTELPPLRRYSTAIPMHKQYVLQLPVDNSVDVAELVEDAGEELQRHRPEGCPEGRTGEVRRRARR